MKIVCETVFIAVGRSKLTAFIMRVGIVQAGKNQATIKNKKSKIKPKNQA